MTITENAPNSEGSLPTSSAAEVTAKDCDTLELLQFEENDLIAFLGCDGYQINVADVIKSFRTKEVTSRMLTTGNILTILSVTEKLVTFRGKNCQENGSVLLAHALFVPNCNSKLVDDRRRCFFFNFSYDEIYSIASVFEKSILCEYGANQLSGCGTPNTPDKDRSGGEHSNEHENEGIEDRLHTNTVYVDWRSRRTYKRKQVPCYVIYFYVIHWFDIHNGKGNFLPSYLTNMITSISILSILHSCHVISHVALLMVFTSRSS